MKSISRLLVMVVTVTAVMLAVPTAARTQPWTTKPPMPTPRAFPAIGSIDGKLYVAGGELHLAQLYRPDRPTAGHAGDL